MDINNIKKMANDILNSRCSESSFIEYKKSELQLDKILKTICAYANNYYLNDQHFLFIGVEENNDQEKATPILPIIGIEEGKLEIISNTLNSLRAYIYPKVKFDIIINKIENRNYIFIMVPKQSGGPFSISDKVENDKKFKIKPGRYIRNDFESRLATVQEEYELMKKFANYSFEMDTSLEATLDDISFDYLKEYISKTSKRIVSTSLSKLEIAKSLNLINKNDPTDMRVYNFAVLMFSESPEKFIANSYTELIIDLYGTRKKMESKIFCGPIWTQYFNVIKFIKDNYLHTLTIRNKNEALNTTIENFPFTTIEELVANAIIHNEYMNKKNIQIYISEKEINIINYNKPLPPIDIKDLNERRFFNERNFVNPVLRDMFKKLHIIESFGTGIGEAKKALEDNHSPNLYYKTFKNYDEITSVVILVNENFDEIHDNNNELNVNVKEIVENCDESSVVKKNLLKIIDSLKDKLISNSVIQKELNCKETNATAYIKIMNKLNIIQKVPGAGKGKYKLI